MSNPGDPGREQVLLQWSSPADAIVSVARMVEERGGVTFEHGYGPPPGVEWDDDHTPGPDEDVLWYAEAVIRRKVRGQRPIDTLYRGEALVRAGASHGKGAAYACVDLLEKCGANVVVFDNTEGTTP